MRIALVGHGKMGQLVEQVASARGHEVVATLDTGNNQNASGITKERLNGAEVAIDFSSPDAVIENIRALMDVGIPVVVGTTGWHEHVEQVRSLVSKSNGSLVYGANFSVGMNLFFRLIDEAGKLFARHDGYDPFLIEHHHQFKKDAPSGTAIRMAKLLGESYQERTPVPVSVRAGFAPGTHELGFDSEADTILLVHTARSREGFASGAILAAERIAGRKGFFEFSEILFEGENQK
jgi:4-hydroxy-tetrahydrodipicolinate reductase